MCYTMDIYSMQRASIVLIFGVFLYFTSDYSYCVLYRVIKVSIG